MDLKDAMTRITELETEREQLLAGTLDKQDRDYIETLKADMRKAAAARERSEARAEALEKELQTNAATFHLMRQAERKGCIDAEAFVTLSAQHAPPDPTGDEAAMEAWFTEMREKMPYLFTRAPMQTDAETRPRGPFPPASRRRRAQNTQTLAAEAYRIA